MWGITPDDKILCHEVYQDKSDWRIETWTEDQTPPFLHCPLRYLDKTPPVNDEWRQAVRGRRAREDALAKDLQERFRALLPAQRLWITLKARPGHRLNVSRLYIAETDGPAIKGRGPQNKLYIVPLDKVDTVEVV